jgi:hypothetical protein
METFEINRVTVQDVPGTDANLQPTTTKRVIFYVGTQGPFYRTYSQTEYSAERVKRDTDHEVSVLQAIAQHAKLAHTG